MYSFIHNFEIMTNGQYGKLQPNRGSFQNW